MEQITPSRNNNNNEYKQTMNDSKESKYDTNNDAEESNSSYQLPKSLQTDEFPKSSENKFKILPKYQHQAHNEGICDGQNDRRRIHDTNKLDFTSRIGQLRMHFNGLKDIYSGTGTVFYVNKQSKRAYAITCAHNLIHYDVLRDKIYSLKCSWFDRRITNNWKIYSNSKSIKKYKIDKYWIHPQHDPKKEISPYDLGVVSFIDEDEYFVSKAEGKDFLRMSAKFDEVFKDCNEILGEEMCYDTKGFTRMTAALSAVVTNVDNFCGVCLYGYPGEKRGELWGERKYYDVFTRDDYKKEFTELMNDKMVSYKIHTTGGQSGSPIVVNKFFDENDPIIMGIHTGTNGNQNYGVKLNTNNVKWVKSCVVSDEQNVDCNDQILSLLICN